MKNITTLLIAFLTLCAMQLSAQNQNFEEQARILKNRIERITSEERALLKDAIKEINFRQQTEEISAEEAQHLKEDAAQKSAQSIKMRIADVEQQLRDLIQNKVDEGIFKEENSRRFRFAGLDIDYSESYNHRHRKHDYNRRTRSSTILSVGFSNLATNNLTNSIENSDFDFWKSQFIEIGSNSKTRLFKNGGLFYVDYGFLFIYNTLRPKYNQYFVVDNNTTLLQTHFENLDKSKFKNLQLLFPAYLEMDFGKTKSNNNNMHYRPDSRFKMGFGGFLGLNVKTKQVLKYHMNDVKIKDIKKGDFNVNNFLYGLNAFVGYRDTSVFMRYYINPLFKDNVIDQNNVTLGLRFEL